MNFGLDQYAPYVLASSATFVAMLVWDFLAPQLRMRRVRRELTTRQRRDNAAICGSKIQAGMHQPGMKAIVGPAPATR